MTPILLADIGGTNSRFALAGSSGRPEHIRIIENDTAPDLETAIANYCAEVATRPNAAVLAVAGPIDGGDEVALTNRGWRFRRSVLARRFGFSQLRVVNDFEAIAWALPRLAPDDAHPLGEPLQPRAGVKLALGPGTGLGVAAVLGQDLHAFVRLHADTTIMTVILRRPRSYAGLEGWPRVVRGHPSRLASLAPQDDAASIYYALLASCVRS